MNWLSVKLSLVMSRIKQLKCTVQGQSKLDTLIKINPQVIKGKDLISGHSKKRKWIKLQEAKIHSLSNHHWRSSTETAEKKKKSFFQGLNILCVVSQRDFRALRSKGHLIEKMKQTMIPSIWTLAHTCLWQRGQSKESTKKIILLILALKISKLIQKPERHEKEKRRKGKKRSWQWLENYKIGNGLLMRVREERTRWFSRGKDLLQSQTWRHQVTWSSSVKSKYTGDPYLNNIKTEISEAEKNYKTTCYYLS